MSLDFLAGIVEERIEAALRRGDVDDLPGRGKPLGTDDALMVPDDLRLSCRILRNANCLLEELVLRKEIILTTGVREGCSR